MSMTVEQARLVDETSTQIAVGYISKENLVGNYLFPLLDPISPSVTRVKVYSDDCFIDPDIERAPGTKIKQISFDYSLRPIDIKQYALQPVFDYETVQVSEPEIVQRTQTTMFAMDIITRKVEITQANKAQDIANYKVGHYQTVGAGDKWDDNTSSPIVQINDARETVRQAIGRNPNTMILSAVAYNALRNHDKVVGRLHHTDSIKVDKPFLSDLFEIENIQIGEAIVKDKITGVTRDIWKQSAILAYVPMIVTSDIVPSYGYSFEYEDRTIVSEPWFDKDYMRHKSNVMKQHATEVTAPGAGYAFVDVLTP